MPKINFADSYFLKPQTKKAFKKETKARARVQYGPEIRALKSQRKGFKQRKRETKAWFNNYTDQIQSSKKATGKAYSSAANAIDQTAANTASYAETLRKRIAAEDQASAGTRGAAYDSTPSQTSASAQLARINSANVLSGVTRGQGASAKQAYDERKATGALAKKQALISLSGQKAQLGQDLLAAKKDRAAFVAAEMPTAREAERQYFLGYRASREGGKNRKFQSREAAKERAHDSSEAAKARRAARINAKQGQSSSGGKGDKPSVAPQAIKGYVSSDNFTPDMSNKEIVGKVLNRWPDLEPKYVKGLIKRWKRKADQGNGKDFKLPDWLF